MRKLTIVLLLIILPADSLYAMTEMYWAHRHSATHQMHVGQHHGHTTGDAAAHGGRISLHGKNGSGHCPVFHYVSGMAVTLPSAVFDAASPAQYARPPSLVAIFRSIDPDVPQHRDKHLLA